MGDRTISFIKKGMWLFWMYILYQLISIPMILPASKKLRRELTINLELFKIICLIIGVVASLLLIRYIWKQYEGDFKPKVTFLKQWTLKQRILIYAILLVAMVGFGYLATFGPNSDNQDMLGLIFDRNKWSMIISVVIFGPIIEELIFRGMLQKLFFKEITTKWQFALYIIISTGLFVWIHGPALNLEMVPYITMGLVFSSAYLLLGDIKYDISLHMINNIIAVISMFL